MPDTLASLVRAKHPGAYDDMDDARLEAAILNKYPGVYDDLPRATKLPTKPAAAEDYVPPSKGWPATIGDAVRGAAKAAGSTATSFGKLAYDVSPIGRILNPGRAPQDDPLLQDLKAIGGAQLDEFRKAANATTMPEVLGHATAGMLPFAGPAAAQAAEKIGAGDAEGVGEAAVLLAAPFVDRGVPVAARAGRAVGTAAKAVPSVALDAAEMVPGIGTPIKVARKIGKLASKLDEVLGPAASESNVGGRLVRAESPTVEAAVSDALAEIQRETPPARTTTPPQRDLPAGYTPRSSAPKLRVVPKPAPEPSAAPAPPKRAYFLRKPEDMVPVADEAVSPSDFTDQTQLPTSWRSRMDQPVTPVTAADVAELAQGLTARGLSPAEAIKAVSKNTQLAPEMRVQLLTALGKVANGAR